MQYFFEGCSKCYNSGVCSECKEGYYLSGSKCLPCTTLTENCASCKGGQCQKCNSGFTLDGDFNCVSSPTSNCKIVYNGVCDQCADGYYLESQACLSCSAISSCELCYDSSSCYQCLSGFFLQDSTTCASCGSQNPLCLACNSASECIQCVSTYFHTDQNTCVGSGPENCMTVDSNDLTNCIECSKNYNWDENNKVCKACSESLPYCAECRQGSLEDFRCEKCAAGYIFDTNGVCIKSPLQNCERGLDAYHCKKCWNERAKVCVPVGSSIPNCKMPSVDDSYCVECNFGYSHTEEGLCECSAKDCTTCNTSDGSICDACIDNHYGDCLACSTKMPNCDTCAGGVCTKCSAGYYLYNSQCHLCTNVDANCITCIDNDYWCASCKPGFLPSNIGSCTASSEPNCEIASIYGGCSICLSGYYLTDQHTCSSCGAIFTGCSTCSASYCLTCSPGNWLDSNSCSPCSSISNCQTCEDATACTKCETTHLLNENNGCTSSSIGNCDVVVSNDPNTCQQCSTGYFWDTTICKACSVPLPNCDTCSSSTTCSLCKTGYYLNLSQCSACRNALDHCVECSSDGSSCLKCDSGYYPNHENKCTRSVLNSCAKVSDDGMCIACPSDKIFACTNGGTSLPNCAVSSSDSSVCIKCMPSYKNQGGICAESNFYLVCSENCSDCSSKNICTVCNSGYFLYDSNGKTSCICNFYLACADSCTDCEPNPNCFMCVDFVVQDGGTCRVDSVGYEISFSDRFIIIDFAHSSSKIFKIASIEAFTNNNQNIDTTNWFISSRSDSQLQIQTDNVRESDLPLNLNLSLL